MLKNEYFLKSCKITAASGIRPKKTHWHPAAGDSAPRPPALLLSLIDINLSKCVLAF